MAKKLPEKYFTIECSKLDKLFGVRATLKKFQIRKNHYVIPYEEKNGEILISYWYDYSNIPECFIIKKNKVTKSTRSYLTPLDFYIFDHFKIKPIIEDKRNQTRARFKYLKRTTKIRNVVCEYRGGEEIIIDNNNNWWHLSSENEPSWKKGTAPVDKTAIVDDIFGNRVKSGTYILVCSGSSYKFGVYEGLQEDWHIMKILKRENLADRNSKERKKIPQGKWNKNGSAVVISFDDEEAFMRALQS